MAPEWPSYSLLGHHGMQAHYPRFRTGTKTIRTHLLQTNITQATRLEPEIKKLTKAAGATGVIVLESHEGKGHWKGMQSWDTVVKNFKGDSSKILQNDPKIEHEDDAIIIFTSVRVFKYT